MVVPSAGGVGADAGRDDWILCQVTSNPYGDSRAVRLRALSFDSGLLRPLGQWRARPFDQKFGADFLAGVPHEPGVYRIYDSAGGLLYVGKARDLRRELAQYSTTRRTKKDRERRALVRAAERIEWQACASELDASLTELGLIQTLPRGGTSPARFRGQDRRGVRLWGGSGLGGRRLCASRPCLAPSGLSSHDASRPGSGPSSDMAHHREGRADERW